MTGYRFTYWTGGGSHVLIDGVNTHLKRNGMHGFKPLRAEIPAIRLPGMDGVRVIGTVPELAADSFLQQAMPKPVVYTGPREFSIVIEIDDETQAQWVETYQTMIRNTSPYEVASDTTPHQLVITLPTDDEGYGGDAYTIECWCVQWDDGEMHGLAGGTVVATFWAPMPFFHLAYGVAQGTIWSGNPETIVNPGGAPLWPDIWVEGASGGNVVGLHITNNTTGKVWSTSQTMASGAGSCIRVNMLTGEAWYSTDSWTTRTSILGKMDVDAEFWEMPIGSNELEWSSTSGTPDGVVIYHAWNYLAV